MLPFPTTLRTRDMPTGIYPRNEWHRQRLVEGFANPTVRLKMRLAHLGKARTLESRRKQSQSILGKPKPPKSAEHLRNQSIAQKKAWDEGRTTGRLGKKDTPETILTRSGANSNFWRGGVTPEHERQRRGQAYRVWRKSVFERDAYTCQGCGRVGGYLHADHIKPFSRFPDLRFEITNGRTLCVPCHRATPTYGAKMLKYPFP